MIVNHFCFNTSRCYNCDVWIIRFFSWYYFVLEKLAWDSVFEISVPLFSLSRYWLYIFQHIDLLQCMHLDQQLLVKIWYVVNAFLMVLDNYCYVKSSLLYLWWDVEMSKCHLLGWLLSCVIMQMWSVCILQSLHERFKPLSSKSHQSCSWYKCLQMIFLFWESAIHLRVLERVSCLKVNDFVWIKASLCATTMNGLPGQCCSWWFLLESLCLWEKGWVASVLGFRV